MADVSVTYYFSGPIDPQSDHPRHCCEPRRPRQRSPIALQCSWRRARCTCQLTLASRRPTILQGSTGGEWAGGGLRPSNGACALLFVAIIARRNDRNQGCAQQQRGASPDGLVLVGASRGTLPCSRPDRGLSRQQSDLWEWLSACPELDCM